MEPRIKAVVKSIIKEMKENGVECTAVVKIGTGFSSSTFTVPGNGFTPGQDVWVSVVSVDAE